MPTAKRRSTEGANWQALVDKEAGLHFILIRLHGSTLLDKLVKLSEMTPIVPNKLASTAGSTLNGHAVDWNSVNPNSETPNLQGLIKLLRPIQHFNNQLTHTTLKNVELLKHF